MMVIALVVPNFLMGIIIEAEGVSFFRIESQSSKKGTVFAICDEDTYDVVRSCQVKPTRILAMHRHQNGVCSHGGSNDLLPGLPHDESCILKGPMYYMSKRLPVGSMCHSIRSTLIVVALISGCAKFEARMAIMGDDDIPIVVSFLLMGTCQVSIRLGKATPRHRFLQPRYAAMIRFKLKPLSEPIGNAHPGNSTIVGSVGHMKVLDCGVSFLSGGKPTSIAGVGTCDVLANVCSASIMSERQPVGNYPSLDGSLVDGAGDSTMRNSNLFQRIEHSASSSLGQPRKRILDFTHYRY
ncbi:hypothetical protein Tco_1140905 [Tanacetum coccineum]